MADFESDLERTAFGTTSIGAVIAALERCAPSADVEFDFCYLRPTRLASYRGYYDHLALGWSDECVHDRDGKFVRHWPAVSDVLTELKGALGKTFEGWKGGQCTMGPTTPLWVANPGHTGGTGIVGVKATEGTVTLITAKVD